LCGRENKGRFGIFFLIYTRKLGKKSQQRGDLPPNPLPEYAPGPNPRGRLFIYFQFLQISTQRASGPLPGYIPAQI